MGHLTSAQTSSNQTSSPATSTTLPAAFEKLSQIQGELQRFFPVRLDLLCSLNRDGKFQAASFSWVQTLGWRPEELQGHYWGEWIHPQDLPISLLQLNSLLNQRPQSLPPGQKPQSYSFENRFRHRDGSYRWLRWHLIADSESHQVIHGWVQDITNDKVTPTQQFGFEAEFLQLAQTLRDVFWIYDPLLDQQLYVSPSYERVWGRSCKSLYSNPQSLQSAIHPEDQAYVQASLAQICAPWPHNQPPASNSVSPQVGLEYRIQTPAGEIRWIHDRSFPLRNAEGKVYRFIGLAEDITEQRQAEQACDRLFQQLAAQNQTLEQAIAQRTTELRAIIDAIPDQIYVITRHDQRIASCNQAFINALEAPDRSAVEGKTPFECFPAEQAQRSVQENERVFQQGQILRVEERSYQEPRSRYLDITKVPLRNSDGEIYALVNAARDITDFRVAEIKLQNSQAFFRAIVEQAAVGISLVSPQGKFIEVNQKFCSLLGYDRDELMTMTFQEITDPEYLEADLTQYQRLLSGEISSFSLEKSFIRKDGTSHWVALTVSGVYDELGIMKYDIGVLQDISDRKMAEAEVLKSLAKERELNELKSRVISMISHEYRTPLTIICSSAELLERYGPQWDEQRRTVHFERIQKSVRHLTELVTDVLLLNRAEAEKLEFNPKPLAINAFFQALFPEIQDAFESQSSCPHELIVDYPTGDPVVKVDELLLRQIVTNLFSNAIKYSPEGGSIFCRIQCDHQQLSFQIQDQGIGIPEDDQPYLFESFHRAANVGTIPGIGLGLSIVKKCVDIHGGTIQMASAPQRGTAFSLSLPVTP